MRESACSTENKERLNHCYPILTLSLPRRCIVIICLLPHTYFLPLFEHFGCLNIDKCDRLPLFLYCAADEVPILSVGFSSSYLREIEIDGSYIIYILYVIYLASCLVA
jgi:hypothetical protein